MFRYILVILETTNGKYLTQNTATWNFMTSISCKLFFFKNKRIIKLKGTNSIEISNDIFFGTCHHLLGCVLFFFTYHKMIVTSDRNFRKLIVFIVGAGLLLLLLGTTLVFLYSQFRQHFLLSIHPFL